MQRVFEWRSCLLFVFWHPRDPSNAFATSLTTLPTPCRTAKDCKRQGKAVHIALVMPLHMAKLCFSHLSAAAPRRPPALQRDAEAGARHRLPPRRPSRSSERRDRLLSRGGRLSVCLLQVRTSILAPCFYLKLAAGACAEQVTAFLAYSWVNL